MGVCSSPGIRPGARVMSLEEDLYHTSPSLGACLVLVQLPAASTLKTDSRQQGCFHGNSRVTQEFGTSWKI